MSESTPPEPPDDPKLGGETASSSGLDSKLAGALCYLFWFASGAVFLVIEQLDRDVRFHAYQSTITFGFLFVLYWVGSAIPVVGWVFGVLFWPFWFVLWLFLMWQAFQGERFKLPVVGEWADEQAGHA